MMKNKEYDQPIFFASCIRIIAVFLIFLFHFFKLSFLPHYSLDLYALDMLIFISGWFAYQEINKPHEWLFKRFRRILIPYWPVVSVAIVLNRIIQYKQTTLENDLLTFLGLSLFVQDPVYVISWFITVILLLYGVIYFYKIIPRYFNAAYLVIAILIFSKFIPNEKKYFLIFLIGYFLRQFFGKKLAESQARFKSSAFQNINNFLFDVQNYSYHFFLLHGGVLLCVIKIMHLKKVSVFIVALTISILMSYFYRNFLKQMKWE